MGIVAKLFKDVAADLRRLADTAEQQGDLDRAKRLWREAQRTQSMSDKETEMHKIKPETYEAVKEQVERVFGREWDPSGYNVTSIYKVGSTWYCTRANAIEKVDIRLGQSVPQVKRWADIRVQMLKEYEVDEFNESFGPTDLI
jgi:hypothetical protein